MTTPPKLIPLYTTSGDVGAYLAYPYIHNPNGEWIGWVSADRKVYSVHGHFVGMLTPELRIVRKRESGTTEPRRQPPAAPQPLRPPAQAPLAPQMPELALTLMDVLEDGPELLPPMDAGELRDDLD